MKLKIYDLRPANKELKVTKFESSKYSKIIIATIETKKKESKIQTDSTWKEVDWKDNTTVSKLKLQDMFLFLYIYSRYS